MILRYATIVLAAAVLATVAALSVSAIEPHKAEAASIIRTCGGGSIALKSQEERALLLINRTRESYGLRTLCVHTRLQRAARAHSEHMIRLDYFAHGDVGARLWSYGYRGLTYAENIGAGYGTSGGPRAVFRVWMTSSAHRSNTLYHGFREVGVGVAKGNYGGIRGYTMYTVDFGSRR
jgi:uncharacterized protein YkwD